MKMIKASFPKRCIGCELCVFEIQRQLNKIGLEDSLIRILRKSESGKNTVFHIEIDPRATQMDIEAIMKICPAQVFEILEGEPHEFGI